MPWSNKGKSLRGSNIQAREHSCITSATANLCDIICELPGVRIIKSISKSA